MMEYVMVAAGGMIGAVGRYAVTGWISRISDTTFPYGTFVVNVAGSFLLGVIATLLIDRLAVDPYWRLFLTIGFLGSFTTFSTVSYESLRIMEAGMFDIALLNLLGSIAFGLVAAWMGVVAARAI